MMNERDFEKHVHGAIQWAATEYNFFNDLKNDLLLLKRDISLGKEKSEVKDIKHALKDFRYIGKAERRFDDHEKHVEEFLQKVREHELSVTGSAHNIQKLLDRLHTEAASLIKDSSLYEGKVRELLLHLRDEIKDHEIDQAQAILMQVEELIEDAEKWIAALPIDLKRAKRIVQKTNFDKSAEAYRDPNLEDFTNPHTLEKIKEIMAGHNMFNLRVMSGKNNPGISGQFGNGANIHVWFGSVRKIMQIDYARLTGNPAFSGQKYPGLYNPRNRFIYLSFKAYLTRFLEIIDDAVQGRSTEKVFKRLDKAKMY